MLRIVVPPDEPTTDHADARCYPAPVMWDESEWASPTPCHLEWIVRKITETISRHDAQCRQCDQEWAVLWDPWRPGGRTHAIWVESAPTASTTPIGS